MKNLKFFAVLTLFISLVFYSCGTSGGAAVPFDVEIESDGPLMQEWFYGNWSNGNANNPIIITITKNSFEFKNENNNENRRVLVKCNIENWGEEEVFTANGPAGSFRSIKITGTVDSKDIWNNPGNYMIALFGEGDNLGEFTAWLGCKDPEDLTRLGSGLSVLAIQRDGSTRAAFWRNQKRQ